MALDLSSIEKIQFPADQYYQTEHEKNMIVLHHTASGRGQDGDFRHWMNTKARIATCVIDARSGKIYQAFSSKYWGHHLGVKVDVFKQHDISLILRNGSKGKYAANNNILNEKSIAIEIDSWGGLTRGADGCWRSYTGKIVAEENVAIYRQAYRGFHGYEKYTCEQIETVENLIKFWNQKYNIPMNYHHDMWDVSRNALIGTDGIWSHTSFRSDKSDVHPQTDLVEMLKGLNRKGL